MRRPLAALSAAVLIGSGLTAIAPTGAAIAAPAPPPGTGRADVVTLITGDVVSLTKVGDRTAATVRPAPGREGITFHTVEVDGGLRVLPEDVIPAIGAGRLDTDLFDVEKLVADGYADAASPTLPLIVTQPAGLRAKSSHTLRSLGATSMRAEKASLASFWKGNTGKVWLDGKVRATLDRSAAQIGAPAAWQAGFDGRGVKVAVLDTGIDANHPDIKGKLGAARNFTDSPDTTDHHGHGTHVAATVAGSGNGSAGLRKGVAYGAELLAGKVLNDEGWGLESWIIEGMQWAGDSGAKVVNMSLGGPASDGTDPLAEALGDISERTGTLFVVAAGNDGASYSVGSPGIAPAALTVGAVNRNETLAEFSSRGPTAVRNTLKPEITAPGVGIVAARAEGTTMGQPVDALYTGASGTSMASPHVAGAAAILAQEHPGWTGSQIKDALVSSAKTAPGIDVYGQGVGRVDLARATSQTIRGTATADFADHSAGESPTRHSRTITYTNSGSAPVTLTLSAPAEVSVEKSVTVPAGGSASVTASIDTATMDSGLHSGWIVGTGPAGEKVTTAYGLRLGAPHHRLTIRAVDRNGKTTKVPALTVFGDDPENDFIGSIFLTDEAVLDIGEDDYIITATIGGRDGDRENASYIVIPELTLDRDTEILLDARKGTPIRIETPKPAEQQAVLSYYAHRETDGGRSISHGVMHFSNVRDVFVTPTRKVEGGSFEFSSRWQLVEPDVQVTVPGLAVQPELNLRGDSPDYPGTRTFPLTTWGAADIEGKAVLLPSDPNLDEETQVQQAYEGGAAVAMLIRPAGQSTWRVLDPERPKLPIPAILVTAADGKRLISRATLPDPRITLELTFASPYLYDVIQVSKNRIPERIVHRVTPANTRRITTDYADNGGFDWVREQRFGWRPWQEFAWNDAARAVPTPFRRVEWVSAGDSLWQHQVHPAYPWLPLVQGGFVEAAGPVRAGTAKESWAAPVVRPATPAGWSSTRAGDVLKLRVADLVDSTDEHWTWAGGTSATLRRDGTVLAELPDGWQDVTTTPGDAAYELTVRTAPGNEDWTYGTRTESTWKFRSAAEGALPLVQVGYDAKPRRVDFTLAVAGKPARGTSFRAEMSADDGKTWRLLNTTGSGPSYSAWIPAHTQPVSLRVTATDRAGNAVTQTVIRAFG
ncbi:S8 family serine peptidase [Actinoplanes sp. NBRC 103695]|uniref:S8 family peptidase n=1 Tax=Actinoplanes sp. NBRC 103695 TaxID=3032202 RepID=UPI00249FCCA4|nr:S8 family serine peptidase [Actinoplanes sp. NBRC 103695]GLY94943.1 peptidase [Actinoplanes sp. NBRC 103695]